MQKEALQLQSPLIAPIACSLDVTGETKLVIDQHGSKHKFENDKFIGGQMDLEKTKHSNHKHLSRTN